MIGERENFNSESDYGKLVMRPYNIDGNEINAFYDSSDNLVFVLDNTVTAHKPNVLLVINPDGDKKWDEILSGDYGVDLETVRPKQDNKYQKLDIEYSGLAVYNDLIKSYNSGDSLDEALKQLAVLRNSAARHSAMMRLNVANEIINKTNATIVKTKESIVRLQARLKTLRAKLAEAKKGIGRGPTKQSAAKILKLESQIEATNEKLKRAQERLKSAQRRLETATVDAELASGLLNQSDEELKDDEKNNKSLVVAPKRAVVKPAQAPVPQIVEETKEETKDQDFEDDDFENMSMDEIQDDDIDDQDDDSKDDTTDNENTDVENTDVKPLFNEDPQILNEDIAFKPISFEAPVIPEIQQDEEKPVLNQDMIMTNEETKEKTVIEEENTEKPVLDSMMPIASTPEYLPSENKDEEEVFEPVETVEEKTTETIQNEPLKLKPVNEEVWQYGPVIEEESEDTTVADTENIPSSVPPVMPMPPVPPMPYVDTNSGMVHKPEHEHSKPSFIYYLLLIILIILAVFTLWLYQRNVKPASPVLTTTAEQTETQTGKTTVFKQSSKKSAKKVAVQEDADDDLPVFLDDKADVKDTHVEPVEIIEPVSEEESMPEPEQDEEITEFGTPEIIGDVPARMTTSGQEEEVQDTVKTEEEILANKPIYEPGSKYDEMFVSEDDVEYVDEFGQPIEYVDQEIIYEDQPEDEEITEYTEEDPYFDAEEAEYQAEQQSEIYYEE